MYSVVFHPASLLYIRFRTIRCYRSQTPYLQSLTWSTIIYLYFQHHHQMSPFSDYREITRYEAGGWPCRCYESEAEASYTKSKNYFVSYTTVSFFLCPSSSVLDQIPLVQIRVLRVLQPWKLESLKEGSSEDWGICACLISPSRMCCCQVSAEASACVIVNTHPHIPPRGAEQEVVLYCIYLKSFASTMENFPHCNY